MAKKKKASTVVKAKKGSKISPSEVKTFLSLYNTYGTYAAVAKMTGRSEKAVSGHIKLAIAAGISAEIEEEKEEAKQRTITITY